MKFRKETRLSNSLMGFHPNPPLAAVQDHPQLATYGHRTIPYMLLICCLADTEEARRSRLQQHTAA